MWLVEVVFVVWRESGQILMMTEGGQRKKEAKEYKDGEIIV